MVFRRTVRMAIEALDHPSSRSALSRRGSYPIPLTSVTTAGFLGRTERGPINDPVLVESFAEYCRYFGGHLADGALSYAVHDYFLHGGQRAVIVRVANRASRARIEIPTDGEMLHLQAKFPGRHEILRVSIDYEQVENDDSTFNLVVQRLGASGTGLVEDQELYPLISVRPSAPRYIGKVFGDSRLISLGGPPPTTRPLATPPDWPGDPVRYIDQTAFGDDGDELTDYDVIGSDKDGTGLFSFTRGPRVDLLSIPLPPDRELGTTAFVAAARFCERTRALFIWDPPLSWQTVDSAVMGSRRLDYTSANVITYFSRVRPRGARARYQGGLPACGAIAGMLAQRHRRGIWGTDEASDYSLRAALTPVVDIAPREAQRLARCGINSFVHLTGGTMRLAGRVTLGSAGLGTHRSSSIERRRLGFFLLNSIEEAASDAAMQGDKTEALLRLEAQLRRFFDDLYQRGALPGRTRGQAYYLNSCFEATERRPAIRLGFSLIEPAGFVEYAVTLSGETAGRLRRIRGVEAEQLFG
jgi:phage tail sheath protein FI